MAETKEILEEVRDLGRRLAGINTDLPTDEALTEVADCVNILHGLQSELARWRYRERYDGGDLPF